MNINKLKVSKVQFEALKNIQPQSTMSVTPVENASATAEQAPYLPRVIPVGTKTLDDIIAEVSAITGESFEQSRFYWNAMIELVTKILTDGVHTEVNFGFWTFALAVDGSVASADAQPSAVANPVYFACYPSEELNRVAEGIETKRNIAAQAFIVEEVFGVDTAKTRLVTAGGEMYVFGRKLSMGATGEKAELVKGESVYPLTFKSSEAADLPTRMTFTIPANVPAGKEYVLRVTAFGKNSEKPEPEIVEKENLAVLAAPAPTGPVITRIKGELLEEDHLKDGYDTVVSGVNLAFNEEAGDKIFLTLTTAGGETESVDRTGDVSESSDTEIISSAEGFWPREATHPESDWTDPTSVVMFKLVKANGQTAERRVYLDA